MNIGKILAKVGMGILKNAIPGVGMVIDTVNAFLPDDKKIGPESTGAQAVAAINSLPAEKQAEVLSKQLDVEIVEIQEHTKVINALADVDKTGKSTRPFIACLMAWAVFLGIITAVGSWSYALIANNVEMMKAVKDSWPLLATMIGIPAGVVNSYFGKRFKEKKARYEMVQGAQPGTGGFAGIIKGVTGLFK